MLTEKQIDYIAEKILSEMDREKERTDTNNSNSQKEVLFNMQKKTTARIGVGKAGPRLRTSTYLKLRADHAEARDAVMRDVNLQLIEKLGFLQLQTKCMDKNMYLTRPDLGRDFDEKTKKYIVENCKKNANVQLIVSDGLSSSAVEANIEKILPIVMDGLKERKISIGTLIFVKYGRVAAQDMISELLHPDIVCTFIGERPGLATASSMSAYLSYHAEVGMPEARRTVISNIHRNGISAVEAGAYIVDQLEIVLKKKASGIDLKK